LGLISFPQEELSFGYLVDIDYAEKINCQDKKEEAKDHMKATPSW
jgi:hypothetical protein